MPGASVVVCEGEKAADAAALIFPKSVCLTSAGGCKAEAKADFEPLAGRRVMIWTNRARDMLKRLQVFFTRSGAKSRRRRAERRWRVHHAAADAPPLPDGIPNGANIRAAGLTAMLLAACFLIPMRS
jgi:hypothetical protein